MSVDTPGQSWGMVVAALRDALRFDWSRFLPVAALYCVPAILVPLVVGDLNGYALEGLVAAGGALVVGFGAFQHLTRLPGTPMLLAAAGTTVSAFLGTLVSGNFGLEAITAGLWAFLLGLFTALGTASWWVLLQCAITLVIAATFPADLAHASLRAGLVLAGGVAQLAFFGLLWLAFPRPFKGMAPPNEQLPPGDLREAWRTLARTATVSSARLRYCVALGLSTAIGMLVYRLAGLPNGYWVPMSVLLVLRWGGLRVTLGRAIARCGGTAMGAGLTTLFAAFAHPAPGTLIGLGVFAAWACYALQFVNYAAFSLCITSYVVFGFAVMGLPEPTVAGHRALATIVGGLIAIGGQLLVREPDGA